MKGMLFLDDSRSKNFTSAYKDVDFLNFFYKQLRLNETDRYRDSFPYLSRCGREHNFLRCDDRPIVFTEILENGTTMLRIGQSSRTYPFQIFRPTTLSMPRNGRALHKARLRRIRPHQVKNRLTNCFPCLPSMNTVIP
ncbi:hypothetical protein COOONC_07965 [Cooperia oncophora]